jgi:hypothetical protein
MSRRYVISQEQPAEQRKCFKTRSDRLYYRPRECQWIIAACMFNVRVFSVVCAGSGRATYRPRVAADRWNDVEKASWARARVTLGFFDLLSLVKSF